MGGPVPIHTPRDEIVPGLRSMPSRFHNVVHCFSTPTLENSVRCTTPIVARVGFPVGSVRTRRPIMPRIIKLLHHLATTPKVPARFQPIWAHFWPEFARIRPHNARLASRQLRGACTAQLKRGSAVGRVLRDRRRGGPWGDGTPRAGASEGMRRFDPLGGPADQLGGSVDPLGGLRRPARGTRLTPLSNFADPASSQWA